MTHVCRPIARHLPQGVARLIRVHQQRLQEANVIRTTTTGPTREERHDDVLRWAQWQHARRRRRSWERALLARVTRG